jgi:ferric-dicitrate binding protein FerR (iron transport regulator)
MADERCELEAAGWEPRGEGHKAIWRRPEGGCWYAHYQALATLRKEAPGTLEDPRYAGRRGGVIWLLLAIVGFLVSGALVAVGVAKGEWAIIVISVLSALAFLVAVGVLGGGL